jgi:tetratricopeptide (TPR) repeat protein
MPEVTPSPPPAPAPAPGPAADPVRRATWRRLLAPVRYARRRPLRALGWFSLTLVLVAGAAAGGTALWFQHHLRAAREAVDRGHNDEAARHLLACRRVLPDHPAVKLLMARVARRAGDWDEAERLLDEYWAAHGDDDRLVFERLLLRAARGDLETAGPPLAARVRAGGPDAGPAREALITGDLSRFRWAAAERALDDWDAAEPDNTTALLLRGKFLEQRQATDGPAALYRRILELDPDHDEARLRLTTVLIQRYLGEEALTHLAVLRERLPANAEVAYQWAAALGLQGRTAEARAALDECLRAHPLHAGALAERARYAALDGDYPAAVEFFARAAKLDRGNASVRRQYAQALARIGRADEAAREEAAVDALKADLERMDKLIAGPLQSTPDDPAVPHQIGAIALRAGQPAEALRWFQTALQVDPDYLPTHRALAAYYQATGNPVLAARHRAVASRLAGKPG